MKLLKDLAKRAGAAIVELTGEGVVEKGAGLYVHRPVLNAKEWNKWAVEAGVPDPTPAEEMHVTIINSVTEVKMRPDPQVYQFSTDRAAVCMLGRNEDALVVCFPTWLLWERHYEFCENGAAPTFPVYRAHLTLSMNAAGFEISDEAMKSMPQLIILGGEIHGPSRQALGYEEAVETTEMSIAASVAEKALAKGLCDGDLTLMDEYVLRDAVKTGKAVVYQGLEYDLSKLAEFEKKEAKVGGASEGRIVEVDGKKFVERDLTMTVQPLTDEMKKKIGRSVDVFKHNDEKRLAWGWASVSTIKGEFLKDLQGDTITTEAQRQWLHSLMKGQRLGKMNHEGEPIAEVVEGLVFDADLQKALGIDLGMEGTLTCTHYICEKTWSLVKTGEWMHSIAGRVLIEVEE